MNKWTKIIKVLGDIIFMIAVVLLLMIYGFGAFALGIITIFGCCMSYYRDKDEEEK